MNYKITDPVILTGKPIWDRLFNVRIAAKYLQSEQELRMFGEFSVGDEYHDYRMNNNLVDIMIPINDMVEYFNKGITVYVSKHEDTKIIYDIISDYLHAWGNRIKNGINVANPPIDDLAKLDEFAAKVYPHAKAHFRFTDGINKTLEYLGMPAGSMSKYLGRDSFIQEPIKPVEYKEHHESLMDLISRRLVTQAKPTNNAWNSKWSRDGNI
jgi:hypothetical protein